MIDIQFANASLTCPKCNLEISYICNEKIGGVIGVGPNYCRICFTECHISHTKENGNVTHAVDHVMSQYVFTNSSYQGFSDMTTTTGFSHLPTGTDFIVSGCWTQ